MLYASEQHKQECSFSAKRSYEIILYARLKLDDYV